MATMDDQIAVRSILDLRAAARGMGASRAADAVHACVAALRDALDHAVTKRVAARVLAISPSMLDRLVAEGVLTTVVRPGVARAKIELRSLVEVAEAIERERARGPERGAVVRATRLMRRRRPVAVWQDVARLPRPNPTARELRARYLASTPGDRVQDVALLANHLSRLRLAGPRR